VTSCISLPPPRLLWRGGLLPHFRATALLNGDDLDLTSLDVTGGSKQSNLQKRIQHACSANRKAKDYREAIFGARYTVLL
jgi:hypothetical protein